MYMRATVTRHYRCGWKCTSCQSVQADKGTLRRQAEAGVGISQEKARNKAADAASLRTEKAMDKLIRDVNGHRSLYMLNVKGCCSACGKRQIWSCSAVLRLIVCAVYVALVAAVFAVYGRLISSRLLFALRPSNPLRDVVERLATTPYLLPGLIAVVGVVLLWVLTRWVHGFIALKRLASLGDPHYYPLIITPSLIGSTEMDDPRVLAVIDALKQEEEKKAS